MIVVDASAMLALLFGETGASEVRETARGHDAIAMSAANYSEVLQKVRQRGGSVDDARATVEGMVEVEPVTAADAICAARLWRSGDGLSLGDRVCLALAERLDCDACTMDAGWVGRPHVHLVGREVGRA